MDFGELIYFLIGIAWLLYSFSKKKKKPTHEPSQESRETIWEEEVVARAMEDEPHESHMASEDYSSESGEEYISSEPVAMASKLDEVPGDYFEKIKMGHKVERSTKKQEKPPVILQEEDEESDNNLDLRQAVIHSEILRAPYI